MAVVSHCESSLACTGERTSVTGGGKYTANYRVTTNNAADGPIAIINYMISQGFGIGTQFSFGNDVDALSFCSSIMPTRQANSTYDWNCVLKYEPTEPQTPGENPSGQPEDNPLNWRWDVECNTALYQEDGWGAYTIQGFPVLSPEFPDNEMWEYQRAAGEWGFVCNSAGIKPDAPPQVERSELIFRVRGFVSPLGLFEGDYVNTLNAVDLEFQDAFRTNYALDNMLFRKYTLKCSSFVANYRRANNVNFYDLAYEIRYRDIDNPIPTDGSRMIKKGWLDQTIDEGLDRRWVPGAPDGKGDTISALDVGRGGSTTKAITDPSDGHFIREPMIFDGHGIPVERDNAIWDRGIWLTWRYHELESFQALPLAIFKVSGT